MNHQTPVLAGHHGVRVLTEVAQDRDGWIAFCQHCQNNDQEAVIASALPSRGDAEAKGNAHEYRHAGCDPQHILHVMRVYGTAGALTQAEIDRRLSVGEEYSSWLLAEMEHRGLVIVQDVNGTDWYQRVTHGQEQAHA